MEKYKFELDKQQLDIIMKALGELPLKEALSVFNVVNAQFVAQINPGLKEAPNA